MGQSVNKGVQQSAGNTDWQEVFLREKHYERFTEISQESEDYIKKMRKNNW